MAIIVEGRCPNPCGDETLRAMFEDRKSVFVDLLGWDIPVLEGRFELDEFDDQRATYLIISDGAGDHLGSARLLPTTGRHILGSLFTELCAAPPPTGAEIFEITRFSPVAAPECCGAAGDAQPFGQRACLACARERDTHLYRSSRTCVAAADPGVRLGLPPAWRSRPSRVRHGRRTRDRDPCRHTGPACRQRYLGLGRRSGRPGSRSRLTWRPR